MVAGWVRGIKQKYWAQCGITKAGFSGSGTKREKDGGVTKLSPIYESLKVEFGGGGREGDWGIASKED